MINPKTNLRELAYVCKIDKIEPIEGSDNCEAAYVGGWHIMVRKETFKEGDLAIYFEIDSCLDVTKPEFAFLEKKHGAVKTQRYTFGSKGNFISQGLLMHPSDFGWEVHEAQKFDNGIPATVKYIDPKDGQDIYEEGAFLTEKLGVTYSVPEDNKRKSPSLNKYEKMALAHKKLFKNKFIAWLYGKEWGKKLLFFFFGKKKDKKTDWPAWVVKTDEERCLVGSTNVLTDKGYIQISNIVNNKLNVKVLSYNEHTKQLEYKLISNYQKYNLDKDLITIEYPYKVGCSRRRKICCTSGHKFLTEGNIYKRADELKIGDTIFEEDNAFPNEVIPIIYGLLLGDSHIQSDKRSNGLCRVTHTNGENQKEYLKYKESMFEGSRISKGFISNWRNSKPVYHCSMPTDSYIDGQIKHDWLIDGKKTVTKNVIDKITEESLAFWYMDDGCLSNKNSEKNSPTIRLNTQGFSYEENLLLSNMLVTKFGIGNTVETSQRNNKTYYLIRIRNNSVKSFLEMVSPYMHNYFMYKTLPEFEHVVGTKEFSFKKGKRLLPVTISSIELGQTRNKLISKHPSFVYDIEVQDNHNFIADGILVHNCQNLPRLFPGDATEWIATEKIDGTSTTFTVKGFGRKREFYVCSRNVVFNNPTKEERNFYKDTDGNVYLEMAEKYNVKEVMSNTLDMLHKEDSSVEYLTVQGETFGGSIQKRGYSTTEHDIRVFNVIIGYKNGASKRLNPIEGAEFASKYLNMPYVPIVDEHFRIPETCDDLLALAGGKSQIDGQMREGLVFRTYDGVRSFKAVDNEFLLKYHG